MVSHINMWKKLKQKRKVHPIKILKKILSQEVDSKLRQSPKLSEQVHSIKLCNYLPIHCILLQDLSTLL